MRSAIKLYKSKPHSLKTFLSQEKGFNLDTIPEFAAQERARLDEQQKKWNPEIPIRVPQNQLPVFRTDNAVRAGVERNIMFRTWGGLGDQICAEPTLRYALRMFKDCNISLASEVPELFKHLQFKRVFDLREEIPNYKKYLTFETITAPDESNLVWQFFSHLLTNCVDFPSLCALRQQLPVEDRVIKVVGEIPSDIENIMDGVAVHPGAHWQSKTFPAAWWNRVLAALRARGEVPILVGGTADDNRGTVKVDAEGCIDLRDRLSISESIWVLHNVRCLLTNDSSPLHMAASGPAWIGYVATCKHPDMITHWRLNAPFGLPEWQWREKNFSNGGIWEHVDYCPNKAQTVEVERVDPKLLESWLPDPAEFAQWAVDRKARI